jgi:ABC-type polysaccharide/polyol phosphate transport system ATPase subunit
MVINPSGNSLNEAIIRLEDVCVEYRVPNERIGTFKEYMIRLLEGRVKHRKFSALDKVSLDVNRGEVFGLIGQNGAGKSTLLKLVARVLRPTHGRVVVSGHVAPLLEVGAGFHPELTGRENIFLNGAMLGFSRQEMQEKFPRIVEFSELGDFIDAPLRTYSSGMSARLGFAVATDSQPDVLIVDEILSVGDEAFQHKSFERIQAIKAQGATILLVSHSMTTIENMCQRAAWLHHGRLIAHGDAKAVVAQYISHILNNEAERLATERKVSGAYLDGIQDGHVYRWGNKKIEITKVQITNPNGTEQTIFNTGQPLTVHISYDAHEHIQEPIFGVAIHRNDGIHITGPNTAQAGVILPILTGTGRVTYEIESLPLLDGLYNFSIAVVSKDETEIFDYHDRIYPFRVINQGAQNKERYGLLTLGGKWKFEMTQETGSK